MSRIGWVIFFAVLFLSPERLNASHIVGGTINYRYLGGNQYKITFKIYRDCSSNTKFDGDSTASMFTPFYYGIFEGNIDNNIFPESQRQLPLLSKTNINPIIVNACLTPNNSCVEEGIYETTITLPRNEVGYTIIHQRCCRNDNIINLEDLPGTNTKPGITLKCYLPPTQLFSNNSPVFKKFPPIFICKNQSFYFDHSATDADGDNLRYFLSTPIGGLTSEVPASSNQSLSDNVPISWSNPYRLANVLGGSPELTIDSNTGFLSCKPNANGRFVVSVIVIESRNGIPIDTVSRDFQFNVVECDIPKADMPFISGTFDPNTNKGDYRYTFCDTLFVYFKNTSSNATNYIWDFGDPASGLQNTSTDFEPNHLYSDTGTYWVKLVAIKTKNGNTCKDSTYRRVRVYPRFKVNFTGQNVCEGVPVSFKDISTSYYGYSVKWQWDFGDSTFDTMQHPVHYFKTSGMFKVKLRVTDSKYCIEDTSLFFVAYPKPNISATIPKFCLKKPNNVRCNTSIAPPGSINNIWWNINGNDSFLCDFSYLFYDTQATKATLYASSDLGCLDSASYILKPEPKPISPNIEDSIFLRCNKDTTINIYHERALKYLWSDGSKDSIRNLSTAGIYKFTITYLCDTIKDSFIIFKNRLSLDFTTENKCPEESLQSISTAESFKPSPIKYWWDIQGVKNDTTPIVFYRFTTAGSYFISLTVTDTFGCSQSLSKSITVYPKPSLTTKNLRACLNDSTELNCSLEIIHPYMVERVIWMKGLDTVSKTCKYRYKKISDSTDYFKLYFSSNMGCIDSGIIAVELYQKPNPFILKDSFFMGCNDSVFIDITDTLALSYQWSDGHHLPVRNLYNAGIYRYKINYPCTTYEGLFKVIKRCSIKLPSAFTPNGDGNNDLFSIRGYGVKKLIHFKIYNRWGHCVFQTTDENQGWDGTLDGVPQNSEMYFYTYEAELENKGDRVKGEGQVLLLR